MASSTLSEITHAAQPQLFGKFYEPAKSDGSRPEEGGFVAVIPDSISPESFAQEFQNYSKTLETTYLVSKMKLDIRGPIPNKPSVILDQYFQGMGYPKERDWRKSCQHVGINDKGELTYAIGVSSERPFAKASKLQPAGVIESVENQAVKNLAFHPIFHFAYPPVDFSSLKKRENKTMSGLMVFLMEQGIDENTVQLFNRTYTSRKDGAQVFSCRLTINGNEAGPESGKKETKELAELHLSRKVIQKILEDEQKIRVATREYFERIGLLDVHALSAWLKSVVQQHIAVGPLADMIAEYLALDLDGALKIRYQGVTINRSFS